MMNDRLPALQQWLTQQLGKASIEMTPLQQDASLRRFYRLNTEPNTVLMDAALDLKNQEFITAAALLKSYNLNVPTVFFYDLKLGLFQLEDFGDNLLFNNTEHASIESFLKGAVDAIIKIQSIPTSELSNPPIFDAAFIQRELGLFIEWFVNQYVELQLTNTQQSIIEDTFHDIEQSLLTQSYVCMHRDFHSKNIMVLSDQSLGILDFQDLMIGPATYDLVSLLKDCYIDWPAEIMQNILQHFFQMTAERLNFKDYDDFVFHFDMTGLQRHLKVLGGFSKIYFTRNNSSYLQYFDRVLAYVIQVTAKYPQLDSFNRVLTTVIIPKLFKAEL